MVGCVFTHTLQELGTRHVEDGNANVAGKCRDHPRVYGTEFGHVDDVKTYDATEQILVSTDGSTTSRTLNKLPIGTHSCMVRTAEKQSREKSTTEVGRYFASLVSDELDVTGGACDV
jgi:hypothetical protein